MNPTLLEIEAYLARKPGEVCRVLGMSYSSYAGIRAGERTLPAYIELHIDTLRHLSAEALNDLVRKRLNV